MKQKLVLIIAITFLGCLSAAAQRYRVNGKEGKIRVVEYELTDGKWDYVKGAHDIYVENGYEFEAVPPVSDDEIIMEYNSKYYHVIWPDKELQLIDDMGKDGHLGIKNRLRYSVMGDFYFSSVPALAGLTLTLLSFIVFLMAAFEKKTPYFMSIIYAVCICGITCLELGAAISLSSDAYWWCNPDYVGYLKAILFTLLFGLTIALQFYSLKIYKIVGELRGFGNSVVYLMCIVGMVAAAIAFIGVLKNFLFVIFCAIFTLFFFGKARSGSNRRIDGNGNTYYVDDLGVKK